MNIKAITRKIETAHSEHQALVHENLPAAKRAGLPFSDTSSVWRNLQDKAVADLDRAFARALAKQHAAALYGAGYTQSAVEAAFQADLTFASLEFQRAAEADGWGYAGGHIRKVVCDCPVPVNESAALTLAQEITRDAKVTAGPAYRENPRLAAKLVAIDGERSAHPGSTHIEIHLVRDNMGSVMLDRVALECPRLPRPSRPG